VKQKIAAFVVVLFVVLIGTTMLAFVAGEIYVRRTQSYIVAQQDNQRRLGFVEQNPGLLIQNTAKGKRLIPGAKVVIKNPWLTGRDIPVRINSLGFRGDDVAPEPRPGVPRILMLGDSITWGDYVRDEETYVRQTANALEATLGYPVEAINAGVGDTGSQEQIDILEESGLQTHPDIVVLGFYLNDSRPAWGFSAELLERNWVRRHSLLVDKVYEKFELWRWIQRQGADRFAWVDAQHRLDWKSDHAAFLELARLAQYDWGAAWVEDSWRTVDQELTRLEHDARRNGFRVATLTFPVRFQVYAETPEDSPQQTFAALAQKHGFSNLNLLPLYKAHAAEDILFDQCHPTAAMNRTIGAAVADFLRDNVQQVRAAHE
jgi:lysophospholipase L1-like esterase